MHADSAPLIVVTPAMVRQWCEDVWRTQPLRNATGRARWTGPTPSYFTEDLPVSGFAKKRKAKPRAKKGTK